MVTDVYKKEIKIGNRNYTYDKDEDGKEFLSINEKMDNRDIKVIIKGSEQKSRNDVEQLILDVLGGQYIQRCLEELI